MLRTLCPKFPASTDCVAGVKVKVKLSSVSDPRSRSSGGECKMTVDIGYGGAFYAIVDDRQLGLDVKSSRTADIVDAADAVTGS